MRNFIAVNQGAESVPYATATVWTRVAIGAQFRSRFVESHHLGTPRIPPSFYGSEVGTGEEKSDAASVMQ